MQRIETVLVPIPLGGVAQDPRDPAIGMARTVTNFDIVTDRHRAIPYYDSVDGNSNQTNDQMQNWCIALGASSLYRLFGLGRQTATSKVRVFEKNLTTGGSNDLDDNAWTETANNLGGNTLNMGTDTNFFVYYARTGYIYGAHTGANIWRYDPTGVAAFVDTHQALTYTKIAQGLVHTQDDILYVPYDNKIATNNNGTWTVAALTLPAEFYITSICEYGADLAIACAPLSGVGKSRVYVWDRNSALTTIKSNIEWGEGIIQVVEEIQGYLVGISYANDASRSIQRITFRYYSGSGGSIPFKDFRQKSGVMTLKQAKQKLNNRIFFMLTMSVNGTQREGVWSISKEPSGPFVIVHERTPNNDTLLTTAGVLRSFFVVGDFMFIAYVNAASTEVQSKTNDQASYTATSVIETIINPNMPPADKKEKKKLLSCGAMYDGLPSAGQAVVKARINNTNSGASYTTIFTETTDDAVKTEPVPVPSGGSYLTDGEEFEFQINSTGGAVPTFLIYKYSVDDSNT